MRRSRFLPTRMKTQGITLIEMAMGLAILAAVLVITLQVLSQILHIQGDQEAMISAQTRLRRVTEVIAQDVRGAVFGGIVNQPRASDASGFSVALLSGGNGYPVVPYNSTNLTSISVVGQPQLGGSTYSFLYSGQQGVILPLAAAPTHTSGNIYNLSLGCTVTLPFVGNTSTTANNTLLFPVRVVSYWLDNTTKTLRYQQLGQAAQDVAYNITAFSVEYVYRTDTGNLEVNPSGYINSGTVQLSFTGSGVKKTLVRLRITLAAQEKSFGIYKTRTFSSELSLANNGILTLDSVVPCL